MKTSNIFIIFSGLLVLLVVASMLFNSPVTTQDVYQYVDHDSQVVCYILKNGNGISCLPLSEVNLSE